MMVSQFKEKLSHSLKLKIITKKIIIKIYILAKDKETNKFFHNKNILFTKSKLENYINNCFNDNKILLFGIFYNDIHIGNFKLEFDIFNFNCSIGYLIGEKKFLGKGIAYKSLKKIISFLFRDLNIRIIFTEIVKNNKKSIRLIEKNNFKHIYTLKKREYISNMAHDVLGYEIKNKKINIKKFPKKFNQSKKKYILKCN